jgi:mitotic spindle assembly checkpoint protein MAD1
MSNPESNARNRIDMLEKTVVGYKELCAKLEQEMQQMKAMPDFTVDVTLNSEQYERLRKELNLLRLENEKIRKKKDELELELENHRLRGNGVLDDGILGVVKQKVLHMAMNPSAQAYDQHQTDVAKLQAEIERLKMRNRELKEGNEGLTVRLNDTNMTINVKDINSMRSQLQTLEAKNQHLKEIYKAASQEFREVCYMLFGYRVDRIGNTNYRLVQWFCTFFENINFLFFIVIDRISSMYAECEEDYLNFRLNESGVLDMLETEYSESLAEMMRTQLAKHNSLPAFLSALTLELLTKSTITVTC